MTLATYVFQSLVTIKEMMFDRQCDKIANSLQNYALENVEQIVSHKNIFTIDLDDNSLRIVYALAPKFKFQDVKKHFDAEFECYILVSREKVTSTNVKSIEDYSKNIQIYELKELQFNITKHVLVPKHEVIKDETEIVRLIEMHHLKSRNQFPILLKTDPVAKYLNAKPGSIIKVTRYSPTSGEHIVYRCCV